jgi:hypothetical protein
MKSFFYVARDSAGDKVTGTLEAADKNAAVAKLKQWGRFPVSLTEEELPQSSVKPFYEHTKDERPTETSETAQQPKPKALHLILGGLAAIVFTPLVAYAVWDIDSESKSSGIYRLAIAGVCIQTVFVGFKALFAGLGTVFSAGKKEEN